MNCFKSLIVWNEAFDAIMLRYIETQHVHYLSVVTEKTYYRIANSA